MSLDAKKVIGQCVDVVYEAADDHDANIIEKFEAAIHADAAECLRTLETQSTPESDIEAALVMRVREKVAQLGRRVHEIEHPEVHPTMKGQARQRPMHISETERDSADNR